MGRRRGFGLRTVTIDRAHASGRVAAILLARSAVAVAPIDEMRAMTNRVGAIADIDSAAFAFSEQGEPSLRDVIRRLRDEGFEDIVLLPLFLPMEPSLKAWLVRVLSRWRNDEPENWPTIRLAPAPMATAVVGAMVEEMARAALMAESLKFPAKTAAEGSMIPTQKHRVLFCMGGPCNNAGAPAVWGHFRNEQIRLDLHTNGEGTVSAKASCLGPCSLAPVVQVYPEGVYYGGVDEAGIDRIIAEHILGGKIVASLAYAPTRGKQRLRPAQTPPRDK